MKGTRRSLCGQKRVHAKTEADQPSTLKTLHASKCDFPVNNSEMRPVLLKTIGEHCCHKVGNLPPIRDSLVLTGERGRNSWTGKEK